MVTTIALIGLGPGAEPHVTSLADLTHRVEVKAAASRTEDRTRAFARSFGFPVTTDIDAVIADFLDAIEQDRDPVVTGEESLASQRLIADILTAASTQAI